MTAASSAHVSRITTLPRFAPLENHITWCLAFLPALLIVKSQIVAGDVILARIPKPGGNRVDPFLWPFKLEVIAYGRLVVRYLGQSMKVCFVTFAIDGPVLFINEHLLQA